MVEEEEGENKERKKQRKRKRRKQDRGRSGMYTKKDENEKCERGARKESADMIGQKQQTSFNYERSYLESKVDKAIHGHPPRTSY